ncbi:MAG TPA: hypothetical protein VMF31_03555 [Solirubrobacterales bacterium]|nr:hypothetical protein [Solirubrobacterales bacterium]
MIHTPNRLAVLGVGAVLLIAGLAGCGGSDDDSGGLSKDEFIAQADQICADATAATDANEAEFDSAVQSGDLDAAADLIADSNTTIQDAIDEIAALEPPEDDQATIDEFLSLSDDQADVAGQVEDAIRAGDNETLNELGTQADKLQKESDALADDYGFIDCGSAANDA